MAKKKDLTDEERERVKRMSKSMRRDVADKNAARAAVGLELMVIKTRRCILCRRLFESVVNRTCGCGAGSDVGMTYSFD